MIYHHYDCFRDRGRKSTDAGYITDMFHQIVHDMVECDVNVMSPRVSVNCDPEARNLQSDWSSSSPSTTVSLMTPSRPPSVRSCVTSNRADGLRHPV